MKFQNAYVDDPRKRGEHFNPILVIEIDENLRETSTRYDLPLKNWRITSYGPFIGVDQFDSIEGWAEGEIGDFNTAGLHREALVDVLVYSPDEEMNLAIGLDRARRTLRKYDSGWQFVLDDLAGQHGQLIWRLQQQPLTCITCERPASAEAYYAGTYMPYCSEHMYLHNRRVRNLRTANS